MQCKTFVAFFRSNCFREWIYSTFKSQDLILDIAACVLKGRFLGVGLQIRKLWGDNWSPVWKCVVFRTRRGPPTAAEFRFLSRIIPHGIMDTVHAFSTSSGCAVRHYVCVLCVCYRGYCWPSVVGFESTYLVAPLDEWLRLKAVHVFGSLAVYGLRQWILF